MIAAVPFPEWINPEIIPGLPFRWYGLMYVVAFTVAYLLINRQFKQRKLGVDSDTLWSFFTWGIVGLILGARIFATLVYDTSGQYWLKPWLIFWPFDPESGAFTGFRGMSYHGGLLGAVVGTLIYSKRKKLDYMEWTDMVCAAVPFGFSFGRLGNFINAELYGRVTASPLGMIFPGLPSSERFPAKEEWVRVMADKANIAISSMNDLVNLPRHPSQLYESLFEGVLLGLVLWFWAKKRKPFPGFVTGCYLIGYGTVRFFLEYLRAPDEWMGYIINFSGIKDLPYDRFITPWAFSMGQILCFLMIAGGTALLAFLAAKKRKRAAIEQEAALHPRKLEARKLRKKLK
jgi:phosphatidylglycerol:prolipoprotein diacylglycerol transferase